MLNDPWCLGFTLVARLIFNHVAQQRCLADRLIADDE